MRYDLEFNVVSQLSSAGLSELAEIFYGEDGTMLTPAQWDTKDLISLAQVTSSAVDTSRFNNLEAVPSWLYSSGVANTGDIKLMKIVARNNMMTPLFSSGSIFFNKYEFKWGASTIRKSFEFDETLGHYKAEVDHDVDPESVTAFTLRFKYPGYVSYEKEWTYVEFVKDDELTLKENLKSTFMTSTRDYKLTVVVDEDTSSYVYLSGPQISASQLKLGTGFANKGSLMALGEYPVDEDTFSIDGFNIDNGDFNVFTSTMVYKNITDSDFDINVNYDVKPILTYTQTSRANRDTVSYAHANILPSVINFKNGVIALHNTGSAGGTIETDQGNSIVIPVDLTLEADKTDTSVLDAVKCTARLTGIDDMPVKDALIRFEINSDNEDVKFIESGSATYSTFTGIDGQCIANAFIDRSRFGWFLQRQWVSGNKLYVPFDIKTAKEDEIYLYFITSDDPILGKLNAAEYEVPLSERYNSEESLETYEIDGRKVAYVKMMNRKSGGAEIVYSSFVKPKSVTRNQTFNSEFKNLYIENSSQDFARFIDRLPDYMSMVINTPVKSFDALGLGYTDGIVPNNTLDYYRATTTDGTIIEFEESIPNYDNIIGYWLITGSSSDVTVKAIFEDNTSFMYLESNEIAITTGNYIKSEYEFILVDSDTDNQNTALASFGYYTVSEYLDNPYKQSACTYTCKYSDPVTRSCVFGNDTYTSYYANDGVSGICTKPANHDSLPQLERCPITSQPYLTDNNGDPLFIQEEVIQDVFVDTYSWTDDANFLAHEGKTPHIALRDGDITQGTFDTLLANGDILPRYQPNNNYEKNAWGFINPFIMHAQ